MTEKGLAVLSALVENNLHHLICQVTIGTDKNVQKDYSEDIMALCTAHKIPWSFRHNHLDAPVTRYIIAISWRWMLPASDTLIVFHDSLLPRYRGFAPLVSQLIEGESKIGVTALFGSEEYDKGAVIAQAQTAVSYPIKIYEAIQKILPLYADLAKKICKDIQNGTPIQGIPQNEAEATYSLWRDELDYYIDWSQEADRIERFILATGFPFAGAKALLNGEEIIITEASAEPDVLIHNRTSGKIIFIRQGKPIVVCGKGLLAVQEAWYTRNGNSIFPLTRFRSRFT